MQTDPKSVTKRKKLGRPTLRKNGKAFSNRERQQRWRERQRKKHKLRCYNGEFYTPKEYIHAVRKVMGSIDCDPASSDIANKAIKAKTYYTIDDDGLKQQWHGNVYLNPPYARNILPRFVDKLISDISEGRVKQAILAVHSRTSTKWFSRAAAACQAICFTNRRINFQTSLRKDGWSMLDQVFLYYGTNAKKFQDTFKKYN
jgi:phage N-6-adenine-methyltransferase